ncbi:MAG: hypothetical protein K0S18_1813 [Anaerocolumna sp.]|nr:hypothetical protein [Anaerocolumna sp.]
MYYYNNICIKINFLKNFLQKSLYFKMRYDRILEIWEPVGTRVKVVYPKYFVYTLFLRVNTRLKTRK